MSTSSVEVRPYEHSIYMSLPEFSVVAQAFRARRGKHFINTVRELFLRHNIEDTLGVCLVHRHFDLAPDERLVEEGKTSTPWTLDRVNNANVIASAWAFRGGILYPYEFEVASAPGEAPQLPPAFLQDLYTLLLQNGYQDQLGINAYHPGPCYEEHTAGRANILTEIVGDPGSDTTAPASWAFLREANAPPQTVIMRKCDIKCDYWIVGEGIVSPRNKKKTWIAESGDHKQD